MFLYDFKASIDFQYFALPTNQVLKVFQACHAPRNRLLHTRAVPHIQHISCFWNFSATGLPIENQLHFLHPCLLYEALYVHLLRKILDFSYRLEQLQSLTLGHITLRPHLRHLHRLFLVCECEEVKRKLLKCFNKAISNFPAPIISRNHIYSN